MRTDTPSVQSLVAAVIDQTIGVIVNRNTGERREWWEASYPQICRVTGIKSVASVGKAGRIARANGYIVRGQGISNYKYRHRRIGEPVDNPVGND